MEEEILGDPDEVEEAPVASKIADFSIDDIKAALDKPSKPLPVANEEQVEQPEVAPEAPEEVEAQPEAALPVIPPIQMTEINPDVWSAPKDEQPPLTATPVAPAEVITPTPAVEAKPVSETGIWIQCYKNNEISGCPDYQIEEGQVAVCPNCGSTQAWRLISA